MSLDYEKMNRISELAYSSLNTLQNSYEIAERCEGVTGAFVECGVAQGAQIGMMMMADEDRDIYLFDSFDGIPLCGPKDGSQPGIGKPLHDVNQPQEKRLVSSGVSKGCVEEVKSNIKKWGFPLDKCTFVKGWFQHTIDQYVNKLKIAVLRLDGDLYESTKECLKLYQNVVKGGYVIIDDYGLGGCRRAVDEFMGEFEFNTVKKTNKVIWWKK